MKSPFRRAPKGRPLSLTVLVMAIVVLARSPVGASGAAPTADAGGPYTIAEGQALDLDASGSFDPESDPLTFAWDVDGDGQYDDAIGVTPTVSWSSLVALGITDDGGGALPVEVEVTDSTSLATAASTLIVTNRAPTVTVGNPRTDVAGTTVTVDLSAVDPGADTVTSWMLDWGDGTFEALPGNPATASHTYPTVLARWQISAAVVDEDGIHTDDALVVSSFTGAVANAITTFDAVTGTHMRDVAVGGSLQPISGLVGPDGLLYVASKSSNDVRRYDAGTGAFIDVFASTNISQANGLVFMPGGDLLVASANTARIQRFDGSTGAFISTFASGGGMITPVSLVYGLDGNLYVADYRTNAIHRFDGSTGAFIDVFATATAAFNGFEQMIMGPTGDFFVPASATDNVARFDGSSGAFEGEFISAGTGGIDGPVGLAVSPDGQLLVANRYGGANNILSFDATTGAFNGEFVAAGTGSMVSPAYLTIVPSLEVVVRPALVVNSTGDAGDASVSDGICDTGALNSVGAAECTLRAAIRQSNADSKADSIIFAIPAGEAIGGVWTIRPTSLLPIVSETVGIDGFTQPGAASDPVIALDGVATSSGPGLELAAPDVTVRGLQVLRFARDGLTLMGPRATIVGNWIGTTGTFDPAMGNGDDGIGILAADGLIDGNVVTNNGDEGIDLASSAADRTVMTGNIVGLEPDGTTGSGNQDVGIAVGSGAIGNTIGGPSPLQGNVIALNVDGIEINSNGNVVENNFVGTDATGTLDRGNGPGPGIQIQNGGANNTVRTNRVAFNGGDGIDLTNDAGTIVYGNNVWANGSIGLDSGPNGVTLNSPVDSELDHPRLSSATRAGSSIDVMLDLDIPAGNYTIQVFDNPGGVDPTGFGEGEIYLGSAPISHTGSGTESFSITVPASSPTTVTAMTTTGLSPSFGDSSEFSNAVVVAAGDAVVNSTADTGDGDIGDGLCDTGPPGVPSDECTLRAAIQEVNASAVVDAIVFAIPSGDSGYQPATDSYRISPTSPLPDIASATTIDGTSQAITLLGAYPRIELNGSSVVGAGVSVLADDVAIRGLVINRFDGPGIRASGDGFELTGTFVGTDVRGLNKLGNTSSGVRVTGDDAFIGGGTLADRNVLSGNGGDGLTIDLGNSALVTGNLLGVDATGLAPLGNDGAGLQLGNATLATIGGLTLGEGNVIGDNQSGGVLLQNATNVDLLGNLIGVGTDGTTPIGNQLDTVRVEAGSRAHIEGNTIAHGQRVGIVLVPGATSGTTIVGNRIHENGALGIDLGDDDVTGNDPGDVDVGINGLLNTPVLDAVTFSAGTLTVDGTLDVPAGDYRIEFFANPSGADPSGFGEGEALAGIMTLTHPGAGPFAFTHAFAGSANDVITATATETTALFASTSEFSRARMVNRPPTFDQDLLDRTDAEGATISIAAAATDLDGDTLSWSATGLPPGLAIDPLTGLITGTISYTAAAGGPYPTAITVGDGNGGTAVDPFTWTVTDVNGAPVLDPIGAQVVDEGTALTLTASAADPDAGDTVTLSVVGLPAGATFDPMTGVFAWTPTESQGPASFDVTFQADDDAAPSLGDSEVVTISVNEVDEDPILDPIANATLTEGGIFSVTFNATDGDLPSNTLTYSVFPLRAGVTFDGSTGAFSFVTSEVDGPGSTLFTASVDDGAGGSDSTTFTVTVDEVNQDPVITPISDRNDAEGATVSVPVAAADGDDPVNTLTYAAGNLPPGLSIDSASGEISGTIDPVAGSGSPYSSTVTVTDGVGGSAVDSFIWTVTDVNRAPAFSSDPSVTVDEGTTISFTLTASDPDPGDSVIVSATGLPAGASYDQATGDFVWPTTEADGPGVYDITFTAADDGFPQASTDRVVQLTVDEVNEAPAVDPIVDPTVTEGGTVTFTVTASDPDLPANALTLSAAGLPAGASFDPVTGVFDWPTTEADGPGSYTIDFTATDDGVPALTDTESVIVTVDELNQPPILGAVSNPVVNEGDVVSVTLGATDADLPANTLTYGLAPLPTGSSFDPATGVFSWPTTELDGPSSVAFTASVTDGAGGTDSTPFTVVVDEVNEDPVIAPPGNQISGEGSTVSVSVLASDPDDPANTLTYSAINLPAGLSIAPSTGAITGTVDATAGSGSPYATEITVTDGLGGSASEPFTWTITDTNRNPVIDPIVPATVDEDQLLSLVISATDPDPGDTVTLSASGLPPGATFAPATGVFSWTPTEADGPGTYVVSFTATDDGAPVLADTDPLTITVAEVGIAPTLQPIADRTDAEGAIVSIVPSATDPDLPANSFSYSATGLPPGLGIDVLTGEISGRIAFTGAQTSPHMVNLVVDDGTGLTDAVSFVWVVDETNRLPVLAPIANRAVDEMTNLSFHVTATDPDVGDSLTFSLVGAPAGATINPSTGVFLWQPTEAQGPATYIFDIVVTDDGLSRLTDRQSIVLNVYEVNRDPVLAAVPARSVVESRPLTIVFSATDPDLPTNTLSWNMTGAPAGSVLDPVAGVFTWTPRAEQGPGKYLFTVTVSDGLGGTDNRLVIIDVADSASPPPSPRPNRAVDDEFSVALNARTSLDVLNNDVIEGSRSLVDFTSPSIGTLVAGPNGTLVYRAPAGFTGSTSFTYRIDDGVGGRSSAVVRVNVQRLIEAVDDSRELSRYRPTKIDVTLNDRHLEAGELSVESLTTPANGTVRVLADGRIEYTPDSGFVGIDTFTYTVVDAQGNRATGTVTVTVLPEALAFADGISDDLGLGLTEFDTPGPYSGDGRSDMGAEEPASVTLLFSAFFRTLAELKLPARESQVAGGWFLALSLIGLVFFPRRRLTAVTGVQRNSTLPVYGRPDGGDAVFHLRADTTTIWTKGRGRLVAGRRWIRVVTPNGDGWTMADHLREVSSESSY